MRTSGTGGGAELVHHKCAPASPGLSIPGGFPPKSNFSSRLHIALDVGGSATLKVLSYQCCSLGFPGNLYVTIM